MTDFVGYFGGHRRWGKEAERGIAVEEVIKSKGKKGPITMAWRLLKITLYVITRKGGICPRHAMASSLTLRIIINA
ncbi:hypothetical protein [Methylomicrobium album]|nr:hypothetical protein [Methylomicrobium album]